MEIEVKTAVDWWVAILERQPLRDTLGHHSPRGEREQNSPMELGEILATASGVLARPDEAKADLFRAELTKILTDPKATYLAIGEEIKHLDAAGKHTHSTYGPDVEKPISDLGQPGRGHFTLGCDYGPDAFLGTAATRAGIKSVAFPWKTVMWIKPGYVGVRCGYGAPLDVLYETREYALQSAQSQIESNLKSIAEQEGYLRGELPDYIKASKNAERWIAAYVDPGESSREIIRQCERLVAEARAKLADLAAEVEA